MAKVLQGEKRVERGDLLVGMKSICQYMHGISEVTALKWHRELGMPIRKSDTNGTSGVWIGSKAKLDEWSAEFAAGGAA